MAKYSSKINKIRTFALSLIFIGFLVMYLGIIFKSHPIIMTIFMLLGLTYSLLQVLAFIFGLECFLQKLYKFFVQAVINLLKY